jgi:hypothetical protein
MAEVKDKADAELKAALEQLAKQRPKVYPCEGCDGTGYILNGRACGRMPCPKCKGTGGY